MKTCLVDISLLLSAARDTSAEMSVVGLVNLSGSGCNLSLQPSQLASCKVSA